MYSAGNTVETEAVSQMVIQQRIGQYVHFVYYMYLERASLFIGTCQYALCLPIKKRDNMKVWDLFLSEKHEIHG